MKTQQHLTPSQVEELRELGVEFEDTTCYWALCDFAECSYLRPYEVVLQDYLNGNESLPLYTDKGNGDYDIPAPTLQEVLEKLPHRISNPQSTDSSYFAFCIHSHIYNDGEKYWTAGYTSSTSDNYSVFAKYAISYTHTDLLLCAYNILTWVAIHHPESLIKED